MAVPTSLTEDEFRLLTWPRPLDVRAIQAESLQKHCPLDNGSRYQLTAFPSSIRYLDALPPEILHMILNILDLQNLTEFRAISWRARDLVDRFPPYCAIAQHAPDALRALLSTQMAAHFTAQHIYDALCSDRCHNCDNYGVFLNLFTGYRLCHQCTHDSPELYCMIAHWVKHRFHLDAKAMASLPTLLSLPAECTSGEQQPRRRMRLVRLCDAAVAGPYRLPDRQMMQLKKTLCNEEHKKNRYLGSIRFPALDRSTGKLDWGVTCCACSMNTRVRTSERDNIVYSHSGYLEHFQLCELSQIARKEVSEYLKPSERIGGIPILGLSFPGILN